MSETALQLHVKAGPHDRSACPIRFHVPDEDATFPYSIVNSQGQQFPTQHIDGTTYGAVLPLMRAHSEERFHLVTAIPDAPIVHLNTVDVLVGETDNIPVAIAIATDGNLLTRYVFGNVTARPYFFPLIGPCAIPLTRSFPMDITVAGETHDHPHHRSLWIAHGDVNGTDNWSEEPGHGVTRHEAILESNAGPVFSTFTTSSFWETNAGAPVLHQRLQVIGWATGGSVRMMDFVIDLTAIQDPVDFGDTKEGGILSVRVPSTMDVPRGGRITNSFGGTDEGETWGKAAHWCDYSGLAAGYHGGIAVLDHPTSFRHPTTWHVRNYGLMTANPFGYSAFTGGVQNGLHRLPKGETMHFHYRIVLHAGDATQGGVAAHYLNFACPPAMHVSRLGT